MSVDEPCLIFGLECHLTGLEVVEEVEDPRFLVEGPLLSDHLLQVDGPMTHQVYECLPQKFVLREVLSILWS